MSRTKEQAELQVSVFKHTLDKNPRTLLSMLHERRIRRPEGLSDVQTASGALRHRSGNTSLSLAVTIAE